MKVAILAPPEIPLPIGDGYGGIELITWDLAAELAKSHDVTLYCTPAAVNPQPDLQAAVESKLPALKAYPQDVSKIFNESEFVFDFTHQKVGSESMRASRKNYAATPFLTDRVSSVANVFPTRAVKEGFPGTNGPVIYPGIRNVYKYSEEKEGYLLFLGRIAPYKRPDIAVQVARLSGKKIMVAGHVGKFSSYPDPNYHIVIESMANGECGFVENPTLEQKVELLSKASAVIIPSDWSIIGTQESFGIVAVEALLSGTPVITSGDGGLKEIVIRECGFVCRTLDDYLWAVNHIEKIDPKICRARGSYFTSERYAADLKDYVARCQGV